MKKYELTAEPRESGKHNSRSLRNGKKIPAVIYGSINSNVNLFLHENDVLKYNTRAFENALFDVKSSDKNANGKVALIKSVDVHPLTRRPVHVDLLAIDLNKPVRVFVEIKFNGKPIGLSEGGLLNIVNRQVEIECKPTEIPENISIDISNLGVGDSLHVSDLTITDKLKMISSADTTLAVVNIYEEEVVATPAAAATAEAATTAGAAPAASGSGATAAAPAAGAAAGSAKGAAAPAKDEKKK